VRYTFLSVLLTADCYGLPQIFRTITASQKNEDGWLRQMSPSYQIRHHGLVRGSKRVGDIELRAGGVMLIPDVLWHGAGEHADIQQGGGSNKERAGQSQWHRLQRKKSQPRVRLAFCYQWQVGD